MSQRLLVGQTSLYKQDIPKTPAAKQLSGSESALSRPTANNFDAAAQFVIGDIRCQLRVFAISNQRDSRSVAAR